MNKKDYTYLKSKVNDFFCIDNLREIYEDDTYDFRVSFLDFLLCIEDFYTFVYSPKLTKNAWLLFTWLRTLVRYDGYVNLSHKDVSNKFDDGNSKMMSKPTFFKCINELESYGLVKRISKKRLFNNKYQNDANTYIVISKMESIIPLLDGMQTQTEFYSILKNNFFDVKKKVKPTKKQTKKESNYEEFMSEYKSIKTEIKDFFEFLGSKNKSGKIAKSRMENIANVLMEIYPYDKDLSYAIGQTISKGVKNEKYLYAILRNIYNDAKEEKSDNEKENELKQKYKKQNKVSYQKNQGIDENRYKELAKKILAKRTGYKFVLQELKECGIIDSSIHNPYEQRLIDACNKRKQKEAMLKESSYNRSDRMAMLEKYGVYECISYDNKTFNEAIHWVYEDDSIVPLSVIDKIKKQNPKHFNFNKAQVVNGEIYNVKSKTKKR